MYCKRSETERQTAKLLKQKIKKKKKKKGLKDPPFYFLEYQNLF